MTSLVCALIGPTLQVFFFYAKTSQDVAFKFILVTFNTGYLHIALTATVTLYSTMFLNILSEKVDYPEAPDTQATPKLEGVFAHCTSPSPVGETTV